MGHSPKSYDFFSNPLHQKFELIREYTDWVAHTSGMKCALDFSIFSIMLAQVCVIWV